MRWPYAFLDLTDAQKLERRRLLDWYGDCAQWSVLLPLLAVQLCFLVSWINRRFTNPNDLDTPSSPRAKEARLLSRGAAQGWAAWFRRARWWLGGRVELGEDVFGSRGEVLGVLVWAAWLVLLCFLETGRGEQYLSQCR